MTAEINRQLAAPKPNAWKMGPAYEAVPHPLRWDLLGFNRDLWAFCTSCTPLNRRGGNSGYLQPGQAP